MATGNEELEQFKTQINLCDYAQSQGFELDRKQSSKSSALMRHSCGDKIVITRKPSGHWIYFNIHGQDSGSILDFVASRQSLSLGLIRKELRPWISGGGGIDAERMFPIQKRSSCQQHNLIPTTQDIATVSRSWARSRPILKTDKYLVSRAIPWSIITSPIFSDRVRIDQRNNCIFPHWNKTGSLCGFEIKNNGFTGFSPGGEKGLWCSRPRTADTTMVVCESAIDAMSFAAIAGTDGKRFFSTAGTCSPNQVASLVSAANRMPIGSSVWLAFDNDSAGHSMSKNLRTILSEKVDAQLKISEKFPNLLGQDWNDVLQKPKDMTIEFCSNVMQLNR